eukprot:7181075-Karenia_brevis.AAC.1
MIIVSIIILMIIRLYSSHPMCNASDCSGARRDLSTISSQPVCQATGYCGAKFHLSDESKYA